MSELHLSYLERKHNILAAGIQMVEMFEHDYDRMLKEDKTFASFVKTLPYSDPLVPGDAFRGGRTELFTMYKEAEADETIQFLDFVSLYPTIQLFKQLPKNHPQILFGN
jgi:hypothetical protein